MDYISREDALTDAMCEGIICQECPFRSYTVSGGCMIANYIESIPAADVVERNTLQHTQCVESVENALDVEERKVGKWKQISPAGIYECPFCNVNIFTDNIECYHFCHNCGAKMEG